MGWLGVPRLGWVAPCMTPVMGWGTQGPGATVCTGESGPMRSPTTHSHHNVPTAVTATVPGLSLR